MRSESRWSTATTMRSTRSSSAVVAVLLALALAMPVAAVSTSADGVPDRAEVDSEVEATFTLSELYSDGANEWTLRSSTALEGAAWTVKKQKLSGDVTSESYSGSSFETAVRSSENVETVTVTVTGDVPTVQNYSYDPAERFLLARFVRVRGENTADIDRQRVHHYTNESATAREAIDAAREAIDDGSPQEARRDLDQAISAYNAGNFENAVSNAEDAEQRAVQAQRSQNQTQLLLYAGIGVVALVVVFGGIFYWRSQRDTYDRLR